LTSEQVAQWASDPEAFLKEESEENSATNPRKIGLDVLHLMLNKFGATVFLPAHVQGALSRVQQSAQLKAAGDGFWWTVREAAHLAIGTIALELTPELLDLNAYLPILAEDAASSLPCLRATALWTSGQFSSSVIDARFAPFVQAAIQTIQTASHELPVRIFACRALTSFLPKVPRPSVAPLAAPLLQGLLALLPALSSEVSEPVLDALIVTLELSPPTTAQLEPVLVGSLLTLWSKHVADVSLTAAIVDIFVTIAGVKEAVGALAGHLLPILTRNLAHPEAIPGVTEGSLQIITALINKATPEMTGTLFATVRVQLL
jgi:hypothetical protein